MPRQIALKSATHYSFIINLTGSDYVFTFVWNARESAWYFDIADQDEEPIAVSNKLVVNFPLLTRCVDARRPPGMLLAYDTQGQAHEPHFEDVEGRVRLYYYEPEEL